MLDHVCLSTLGPDEPTRASLPVTVFDSTRYSLLPVENELEIRGSLYRVFPPQVYRNRHVVIFKSEGFGRAIMEVH